LSSENNSQEDKYEGQFDILLELNDQLEELLIWQLFIYFSHSFTFWNYPKSL
jgi:hypothetical protein